MTAATIIPAGPAPDPVPTPAAGIEATVQRGIASMHAKGIRAVPMDGECAGFQIQRGTLFGSCFSCRHFLPKPGAATMKPRLEAGSVVRCLDHVPVHGGSVPRGSGVDQHLLCGGDFNASPAGEGVSA